MKLKNHIIFFIFFFFILNSIKKIKFINLNYIITFLILGILGALLPDLDYINSYIGKKNYIISKYINILLGHRGATHSLFFLIILFLIIKTIFKENICYFYGFFIGYFSHIIADLFTPMGIEIFWPIKKKIKIKLLYIFNFVFNIVFFFIIYIYLKRKIFFHYENNRNRSRIYKYWIWFT